MENDYIRSLEVLHSGKEKVIFKGKLQKLPNTYQIVEVKYQNKTYNFKSKMLGRFNMMNSLSAIGAALHLGIDIPTSLKKLEKQDGVPGRFEAIDCGQDFMMIVDYAHTGDGLTNILTTLNELKKR